MRIIGTPPEVAPRPQGHPVTHAVAAAAIIGLGSWMVWVNNTVALVEEDHEVLRSMQEDLGEIKANVIYMRGRIDQKLED